MKTNHKDRGHALLSPSSAYRWMECPGSVKMSLGIHQEPSSAAIAGTLIHEACDYVLKKYPMFLQLATKSRAEVLDSQVKKFNHLQYCEQIAGYLTFIGIIYDNFKAKAKNIKVFHEDKVSMTKDVWGTLDFAITGTIGKETWCIIIDLKTGITEVEALNNPQTIIYALGQEKKLKKEFDNIRVYIYQERTGDKPYDVWNISKEDKDLYRKEILKAEKKVLDILNNKSHVELNPGDHCTFCPANGNCSALHSQIQVRTKLKLGHKLPDVNTLTIEQKIKIFENRKVIENLLDGVSRDLNQLKKDGKLVPGYKLVESQTKRSWIDDRSKVVRILSKSGVRPYIQEIVGLGEACTQLKQNFTKKEIDEILESITIRSEGRLLLVKDDDPRPEVVANSHLLKLLD